MSEFQANEIRKAGLNPDDVISIDGNGRDWKFVKSGPGEDDYAWRYADHFIVKFSDGQQRNFIF